MMNEISPRLDSTLFTFNANGPKLSPMKPNGIPGDKICQYRTGKCQNIRATKPNGYLHKLCDMHRSKANENQRRLDRKKKAQGFNRRERVSLTKRRRQEDNMSYSPTELTSTSPRNICGYKAQTYTNSKPVGLHVFTNSSQHGYECPPPPPPTVVPGSYRPFQFLGNFNTENVNSNSTMRWKDGSEMEPILPVIGNRQIQELDAAFDESMIPYLFEQLFELEAIHHEKSNIVQ